MEVYNSITGKTALTLDDDELSMVLNALSYRAYHLAQTGKPNASRQYSELLEAIKEQTR